MIMMMRKKKKIDGDGRSKYIHLDGALGAEVGFEDVLQALGRVDVHVQSSGFVQNFCIWIQYSQRHLLFSSSSPRFFFSLVCTERELSRDFGRKQR